MRPKPTCRNGADPGPFSPLPQLPPLGAAAVLACLYFAAAWWGKAMAYAPLHFVAFWPPSGLFAAALLCAPFRSWPYLILGAGVGNVAFDLCTGQTLAASLGFFTANGLEAGVGAWLVRRLTPWTHPTHVGQRELLAIFAGPALLGPALGGCLGATVALAHFGGPSWLRTWLLWWSGDSFGVVLLTVPLVAAHRSGAAWLRAMTWPRALEYLAALALVTGLALWSFDTPDRLEFKFVLLPPLLWIALRFRLLGLAAAGLILGCLGIAASTHMAASAAPTALGGVQALPVSLAVVLGSLMLMAANYTTRRKFEAALSDKERSLRFSLQAAKAGTWEWDARTSRAVWSDEIYALAGLDPAVHHPSPNAWLASVHPKDRDAVWARVTAAAREGRELNDEWRVNIPDGPERWIMSRGCPVRDAAGRVTGYQGIVLDITERKLAEEELLRQKNLLASIVEGTSDAVYVKDRQGRYLLANATVAEVAGRPVAEILGRTDRDLFPSEEAEAIASWDRRVLDKNHLCSFEEDVGGRRFLSIKGPLHDAAGRTTGIFGIARDITESRRLERALHENQARLQAALESLLDAMLIADEHGRFVLFNDAFAAFLRFRDKSECPRNLADYPALLEVFREGGGPVPLEQWAVARALRGEKVTNAEYDLRRRDTGETWTGGYSFAPIRGADGGIEGAVVVARDITESKRITRELSETNRKLEEAMLRAEAANRAKGEFLANMSHELRTPLNGVLGMLQLLDDSPDIADDNKVLLETATESARGLLTIINDILSFAQLDAGKLTIVQEPTDPRQVLRSVCRAVAYEVEERRLTLARRVDDSVPALILTDAGRLRQILLNLLSNALKFTSEGGVTIELTMLPFAASPTRRFLLVTVADTGIGIPDDKQNLVFEPFTQVDGSLTRKYKGTGIGLGIVRNLARLMGGSVCLDSESGVGTTFYVTLSCGRTLLKTPAEDGAQNGARPRPLQGLRVLVAEDDRVNQLTATRFLERLGCIPAGAGTGRQALERLAAEDFDCILMDVQMPEMDGVEATRAIRASTKELGAKARIPIVAMTAHAMPGDREEFLAAGMDTYLSKPVELRDLERVLHGLLARAARRG
ncbi:MAG: PAS domain-containing protein [Desulfovibrionaceae bacterium]